MNLITNSKPNLKKLFYKAENKHKDMFRCLYDMTSILGILVLDEHKKSEETGKFKYQRKNGQNKVHIPEFRFQGSHN